jgi:membrane-associated phospholipid phosphatase
MPQVVAAHALLLLAAAVLALGVGVWMVTAAARFAARQADELWALADLLVPGPLRRGPAYLIVHLALGLLVTVAIIAYLAIAENVLAGRWLVDFDLAFARALTADASPAWRTFFWYVTWLGSAPVVAAVAGVVVWVLARKGHGLLATMWAAGQGGAALLNYALKLAFERPRPDGADPQLFSSGWSFPSGHAMGSVVLCGIGVYLLLRLVPAWWDQRLVLTALLAWPLLVGFSRLYLGVHYASDVIAGMVAGIAWVAICVSGAEVVLQRRARMRSRSRTASRVAWPPTSVSK